MMKEFVEVSRPNSTQLPLDEHLLENNHEKKGPLDEFSMRPSRKRARKMSRPACSSSSSSSPSCDTTTQVLSTRRMPIFFVCHSVLVLCLLATTAGSVQGFMMPSPCNNQRQLVLQRRMEEQPPGDAAFAGEEPEAFGEPHVILDDLNWRVEKLRLEEQNTKRFLKARPRFLPYDECRKWVQAFGRWETEADWRDWIAQGEKRNSYIPSRPDEYYGRLGEWISWEHFLGTRKGKDGTGNQEKE